MFNALKYTQELEKAGFSRDQAEASMRILIDVMNENFATQADIKELELKLESSTLQLESSMQRLETKVDSAIKELDYKLTIKLGAMITVAVGATATLLKVFQGLH